MKRITAVCAMLIFAGCGQKEDMPILANAMRAAPRTAAAPDTRPAGTPDDQAGAAPAPDSPVAAPAEEPAAAAPAQVEATEAPKESLATDTPAAETTERRMKEPPAGKVNINTADADQLATVPGIGPKMAVAIVEYRDSFGKFSATDDLIGTIRGIGEKKFEKMQPYISVGDTSTDTP